MKKMTVRHGLIGFMTFIMVLSMAVVASGLSVRAEEATGAPTCAKKQTRYLMQGPSADGKGYTVTSDGYKRTSDQLGWWEYYGIVIKNLSPSATITNIKSSNKNFMVSYRPTEYENGLIVYTSQRGTVKFGTSKITFTVEQDGKSYNLFCNYIMKKTPSPLKNIKIDGKEYTSKFVGRDRFTVKTGKSTVKVNFKAGKEIKNLKITYYDAKGKERTLKNNSQISIPKKGLTLVIKYRYKGSTGYYKKWKKETGSNGYELRNITLKR